MVQINDNDDFRIKRLPLIHSKDKDSLPALGFGTLIPDPDLTMTATREALVAGFRHFDCAERYRNETEVGQALKTQMSESYIAREEVFITTKLWNTNHRPERVKPAFDASLQRLQLDYLDLYLIHTPFAFKSGDEQDPRDAQGKVIYDKETTLVQTWQAMEALVDEGRCRAIGLSDIGLDGLKEVYEAARIKPSVIQIESHPYLPEQEIMDYCNEHHIVLLAFAPLGHGMRPGLLEDTTITQIATKLQRTPAQVLLAWAVQRGTALLTTPKSPARAKENFDIQALPAEDFQAINAIQTRQRLNSVVHTGVPGFIPRKSE